MGKAKKLKVASTPRHTPLPAQIQKVSRNLYSLLFLSTQYVCTFLKMWHSVDTWTVTPFLENEVVHTNLTCRWLEYVIGKEKELYFFEFRTNHQELKWKSKGPHKFPSFKFLINGREFVLRISVFLVDHHPIIFYMPVVYLLCLFRSLFIVLDNHCSPSTNPSPLFATVAYLAIKAIYSLKKMLNSLKILGIRKFY